MGNILTIKWSPIKIGAANLLNVCLRVGTSVGLNELKNIKADENTMITIQVWRSRGCY
mgnify:CR=1 FL=1|jgi:hypothetical protein